MPAKTNSCKDCQNNRGDKYCAHDAKTFWEDQKDPGECKFFVRKYE